MDATDDIELRPDPVYTARFEKERDRMQEAVGDGLLGVFHVGSTAIPDLPGKPALDVLTVFTDEKSMTTAAAVLDDAGYDLSEGEDAAVAIDWREDYVVFVKMHSRGDERARNQLLFREYLRENSEARREYEQVKRAAADEHGSDHAAYTKAKSTVVASLLERAREEGYAERLPEFV